MPGNGCADVGLRSGLVRPGAEAEVRGDRDREQDPEDDDHDEELDQGEALSLVALPLVCRSAPSAARGGVGIGCDGLDR